MSSSAIFYQVFDIFNLHLLSFYMRSLLSNRGQQAEVDNTNEALSS